MADHNYDSWGVPDRLFGPVSDEFYAAVGRVTMLAALVDDMLLRLAWSLTDDVQAVHSGKPGAALDEVCRRALFRFPDDFAAQVMAALDDVRRTRQTRNAVVHSVWPNPTLDSAFGWRAAIPAKNDGRPTKTFETNRSAFEQVLSELVSQISWLDYLQLRGHSEKARL